MMPKFRNKYELHDHYGSWNHTWTVIGRHGAMHFHVLDLGERKDGLDRYSGGLETHYRTPPEYMADRVPSQDKCWLLGCPCWHDGTLLYAMENLLPFWLADPHNHTRIFRRLESEYERTFEPKCEAA